MGQPKKQSSPRKTGLRRSHLRLILARRVNGKSPVKATATRKETGKKIVGATAKVAKVAATPKVAEKKVTEKKAAK